MKPHSLRKALWISNFGFGAAVVGLLAYHVLEVRPAVAAVVDRPVNFQPERYKEMRKEYEKRRMTGLQWIPDAPVTREDFEGVVLRPDYAKRRPKHWIFSGPMPPPVLPDEPTGEVRPPAPPGLDSIGDVRAILGSAMLFEFTGGKKSLAFGRGDFVKPGDDAPDRFKITGIVRTAPKVYEIRYEVYGSDPAKPERTAKLIFDQSVGKAFPPFLRPAGALAGVPGEPTAGAGAATGEGTGEGAVEPGAGDPEAGASGTPIVVQPVTPAADLTLQDLKPIVHPDPRNPRSKVIEFDDNTYRYFRGKNARGIAETVKTQVHKDPTTGRTVGLRITGFQDDAPADVFDVRRGDILVSINGKHVGSRSEAISIAQKLNPDSIVNVVIDRNGRQLSYRVDPRDPHNKRRMRYFENMK
jgi:hypothetical protein